VLIIDLLCMVVHPPDCGRACQKLAWPNHKKVCVQRDATIPNSLTKTYTQVQLLTGNATRAKIEANARGDTAADLHAAVILASQVALSGRNEAALPQFLELAETHQRRRDYLGTFHCLNMATKALIHLGPYASAIQMLARAREALRLCTTEHASDASMLLCVQSQFAITEALILGDCHIVMDAIAAIENSDVRDEGPVQSVLFSLLLAGTDICIYTGKYDRGDVLSERAAILACSVGQQPPHLLLGTIASHSDFYERALVLLQEAVSNASREGHTNEWAQALILIAECKASMLNKWQETYPDELLPPEQDVLWQTGQDYANIGLAAYQATKSVGGVSNAYFALMNLALIKQDWAGAVEYGELGLAVDFGESEDYGWREAHHEAVHDLVLTLREQL